MISKTRLLAFIVLLALTVGIPAAPALAANDLLPDLGMARLRDLQIENTSDGRRLLRFTTVAVNIGQGPIEVRGQRPNTSSQMTLEQRIYDNAGGSRYVSTPGTMFFAGDGHNHWHVLNFETYELDRLDNGAKVGTGLKSGFCFYDSEPFGSVADPRYISSNSCRGGVNALQTTMGISAGWGDRYTSKLPDQFIDITGLNAGQYRLLAIADPNNWFLEGDESNNQSWVDLQLTGSGFMIQSYGFSATPLAGNQLMNRAFELDANSDNLPDGWTSNGKFTRSNEVVLERSFAGKHSANDNSGYTSSQVVNDLFEGTTYAFTGYVNIPATNDVFTFSLQVRWTRIDGTTISTSTIKTFTTHTGGIWQQVTANLVAPAGTNRGSVRMVPGSLNATIYVDDFKFGRK